MDSIVEADLVEGARAGDAAAFDQLFAPLIESGYKLAFTMLRDRQAAEDIVQEAALKAWRKFHQFRHGESPRAWFLTIVANQCRSLQRGRWWNVLKLAELPERAGRDPMQAVVAGTELRRNLDRLPFDQRLVLYLHVCEDLEQSEVARMLGVRVGTVKSRVHRAVQRLRAEAAAEEVEA